MLKKSMALSPARWRSVVLHPGHPRRPVRPIDRRLLHRTFTLQRATNTEFRRQSLFFPARLLVMFDASYAVTQLRVTLAAGPGLGFNTAPSYMLSLGTKQFPTSRLNSIQLLSTSV